MTAARSQLSVAQVDGRSVVVGALATTPLKLLAPKNHGHAAWVYQSSYGGGFVGEDNVALRVDVQAGASLFLSSQASSKVYRGASARFELEATVHDGATLVCWPDPVACFAGASLAQHQRFHLAPTASLVCVDAVSAGRPANGERWDARRLALSVDVDVAGERCFRDAVLLDGAHGPLRERLAETGALATVALLGPRFDGVAATLTSAVYALQPRRHELAVVSPHARGAVLRLAAESSEALGRTLRGLLGPLVTSLLGEDPLARKW